MTPPDTLAALSEAATQGEWRVWLEPIEGSADKAIEELTEQVRHTDPVGQNIALLDAGGKCPATTGCGPTSEANAAFIVALVNAYRTGQLVPVPSVEKLARVIHDATHRHCFNGVPAHPEDETWKSFVVEARAVIAAMQEGRDG